MGRIWPRLPASGSLPRGTDMAAKLTAVKRAAPAPPPSPWAGGAPVVALRDAQAMLRMLPEYVESRLLEQSLEPKQRQAAVDTVRELCEMSLLALRQVAAKVPEPEDVA